MFDGVPADQFHQFIASSRTSLPIPLSFSLHHHGVPIPPSVSPPPPPPPPPQVIAPTPTFLGCFDLYPSHQILEVVQPHHHHHQQHQHHPSGLHPQQLHHHSPPPTDNCKNGEERRTMEMEEERSIPLPIPIPDDPWSNDEVLTLLRIRSSMENWFPEFSWEHVSRKLAEHGYQRTADKCKEKFEEESRHFNSMGYTKNYRFFSDLEELYQDDNPQVSNEKEQDLGKEKDQEEEDNNVDLSRQLEETETTVTANPCEEHKELEKESTRSKKRKRKHKFEMFKGFCEAVVKRIVAQQEDLHNKLIEDMLKRDEESIAREEAWKCQEMDRINKEIEMRVQEQVIAGDRQAKIVELLKKFTSGSQEDQNLIQRIEDFFKVRKSSSSVTSSSEILPPNPIETASSMSNPTATLLPTSSSETTPSPHKHRSALVPDSTAPQATSPSVLAVTPQSPNKNSHKFEENPFSSPLSSAQKTVCKTNERDEKVAGRRWPRDEVQALINLKCSQTSNSEDNNKEGTKGPLWERISQGMLELGYKRSAKRCKEKWENINKYFRKTKDSNKKRSLESRTCPYFHQLSTLYSQGKLVAPSDAPPENSPASPFGQQNQSR